MESIDEDHSSIERSFDKNNNTSISNNQNGRSGEKYGLRPRTSIKRLHHDLPIQEVTKRSGRSKTRPAPLSKYRRKTANARERHRMKAINTAFESLRKVLPDALEVQTASSTMTKITTLRLAVDYIRALSDVLEDEGDPRFALQSPEAGHSNLHGTSSGTSFSSQHLATVTAPFTVPLSLSKTNHLSIHYMGTSTSKGNGSNLMPLMSYSSNSSIMSASSSPSASRGSLGSSSDLDELLSDDSGLLEDNLDVFHDIPTITLADPFDVLLGTEKGGIEFPL